MFVYHCPELTESIDNLRYSMSISKCHTDKVFYRVPFYCAVFIIGDMYCE